MHGQQVNNQTGPFSTGIGGPQPQAGQQMGQYVNPHYGAREQGMIQKLEEAGNQSGHLGHTLGYPTGQQAGFQTGQSSWQQPWSQTGYQTGFQAGFQAGPQTGQMGRKFGAMELMQAHEVIVHLINGINLFELYRPHVKDQQLMQILNNQVNHLYSSYQNIVSYLHNQGQSSAVPYRAPKASSIQYGLRQPSPVEPNASQNQMDERDVACGVIGSIKSCAVSCTTAALESVDPILRNIITNCAVSCINQAYEVFQWMNQRGMYQIPTLADQTTQTIINSYQMGSQPSLR